MPKLKLKTKIPGKFFILGILGSFISLVMGATGPLIAPFFLQEKLDRLQIVATKAACQLVGHGFKLVTFIWMGFSYAQMR